VSKLKVTLELEELQKMLEEAARLGSESAETWTDYTETGIAFTIVSDYKVLSHTFIEEEKIEPYRHPNLAPRPVRDVPQA
jgi:hypothetical protein